MIKIVTMKNVVRSLRIFGLLILTTSLINIQKSMADEPLRVAIIGLSHSHVHWILNPESHKDIKIVGIVESNLDLAQRYMKQYGYSGDLHFTNMEEMIMTVKPEAVAAFGSIFEHLEVVETCAPYGIHVMVEKPLAVHMDHATKMKALADQHNIHLLTNYETTWYQTNHQTFNMVKEGLIGDLRKIIVHDGHKGPIEIGINKEFAEWLTDPVLNGGGAITDFGCYGANLIVWLTKGLKPESVTAVTQTIKPEMYPKVDDEATIILKYPKMQGIIQASWNWPVSRKDMEVYGKTGYIISENKSEIRYRLNEKEVEKTAVLPNRTAPFDNPFDFFAAIVRNKIKLSPYDLSSLENNMLVVEILDAAKKSAKEGKTVKF